MTTHAALIPTFDLPRPAHRRRGARGRRLLDAASVTVPYHPTDANGGHERQPDSKPGRHPFADT